MPKLQIVDLPAEISRHLLSRVSKRLVSLEQLVELMTWIRSDPTVPEGEWYKDFGSFKLVGKGALPKSILDADMTPYGSEVF